MNVKNLKAYLYKNFGYFRPPWYHMCGEEEEEWLIKDWRQEKEGGGNMVDKLHWIGPEWWIQKGGSKSWREWQ